jgi:lycopene beta-cyclase
MELLDLPEKPTIGARSPPIRLTAMVANDLLILGGGCAGLSLAQRLAMLGDRCPRTQILERRSEYLADRTWCFWNEPKAALTELIGHRWPVVSLAVGERVVRIDCAETPYAMVPAAAFYQDSLAKFAQTPQLELELEVAVLAAPQKVAGRWYVETSAGTHSAKTLVDTRPPTILEPDSALLWQSFLGHEIECVSAVFEPGVAEIMHFATDGQGVILFFYLLPFSPQRALLEVTVFAREPWQPASFHGEMESFLQRRIGDASYTILRSEHGILPMGQTHISPMADTSYVTAGLFAGGARASSGYAFQRIQRWASDCAAALGVGLLPVPQRADPAILRGMDRVFLRVLRRHPERAPELFLALFQKVEIAVLVRFMSDQATLSDYLAIVTALPAGLFLREILPTLRSAPIP